MQTITRTTVRDADVYILNRDPFTAGGNAYGEPNFRGMAYDSANWGRLNEAERTVFLDDIMSMDYVVRSYGTPIAWHSDRGWHVVEQRFSSSTSRHQAAVRRALA